MSGIEDTPRSVRDIRSIFESSQKETEYKNPAYLTPQKNSNLSTKSKGDDISITSSITNDDASDDDEDIKPQVVSDSGGESEKNEAPIETLEERKNECLATKNRRKRFKIAEELYTTEEAYVSTLSLIHVEFKNRLKNDNGGYIVPTETLQQIFMNTEQLYTLHTLLRDKLKERIQNWQLRPRIGDIMKDMAPYFALYTTYMSMFERAIKTLNDMCSKNSSFAAVVRSIESDQICKNLKISQHMLGPVQRIPRYRMLLEDYIQRLTEDSADYPDVKTSLDKVASAANKANEDIAKLENFQLVMQLLRSVSGLGSLEDTLEDSKTPLIYIKHGKIQKMSRRKVQERFLFLFSELLLICKIEGQGKYKCNKKIHVSELMSVQDSCDPSLKHPFEVITKKCSFMLGGADKVDKQNWMQSLDRVLKGHEAAVVSSPNRLGLVAPVWIPDNGVSMCMSCERSFTPILRRHHCRACGKVFCYHCSDKKAFLSYDNSMSRVCTSCHGVLKSRDEPTDLTKSKRGLTVSSFYSLAAVDSCSNVDVESPLSKGTVQHGDISGNILVKNKDKDFQRFWCVVKDFSLHLFAGSYDKKAKKVIPIVGWTVAEPDEDNYSGFYLKIGHKNVDPIYLKFESEAEKETWYDVLTKASVLES